MQKQDMDGRPGLSVLVAEAEPDIQKLYNSFLRGWSVDIADSGEKCIDLLFGTEAGKHAHDMVVIDSHLGGIGAIGCIKRIQRSIPNQHLVVTSTSPARFKEEAAQAGINLNRIHILEKPFRFTQFLSLIPSRLARTSKIGLHNHVLAIYETPEEEFEEAIRFLNDAKDNGEAALFVVRVDHDIHMLKTKLQTKIADLDSLVSDGSLIIMRNEDWYIPDGSVNKHRIIEQWGKLVGQCIAQGKKGLRAFCMMDCFFEHDFAEQVVDYEHTLPVNFEMPFVPICAYRKRDIDMLSDDQKRRLVTCHSHVWTGTRNFTK
jgi:CheY-like chemotaxis protein